MASEIDVCNLALAHLGDEATVASIDPPEGSAQAEHCARFYPIARDALLEMHPWRFSTRKSRLAALTGGEELGWAYAYAVPAGCLRIIAVLSDADDPDGRGQFYATETNGDGHPVICTDQPNAVLRYTERVTDTTKFSPLFVDALTRLLASYMAGPVLKGDAGKTEAKAQFQLFRAALSQALNADANQRRVKRDHTPDWIAYR